MRKVLPNTHPGGTAKSIGEKGGKIWSFFKIRTFMLRKVKKFLYDVVIERHIRAKPLIFVLGSGYILGSFNICRVRLQFKVQKFGYFHQ